MSGRIDWLNHAENNRSDPDGVTQREREQAQDRENNERPGISSLATTRAPDAIGLFPVLRVVHVGSDPAHMRHLVRDRIAQGSALFRETVRLQEDMLGRVGKNVAWSSTLVVACPSWRNTHCGQRR